jgi:hypothetical protein
MPHDRWMGLVQTVLELDRPLRGDDEADRATVLDALRAGRTTLAVPPLGDPLGATIRVVDGAIEVDAPAGTVERRIDLGPGLARVELLRPDARGALRRWILSSPLRTGAA